MTLGSTDQRQRAAAGAAERDSVTPDGVRGSNASVQDELSELVEAARGGDQCAFEQLVRATHRDTPDDRRRVDATFVPRGAAR